MHPNVAEYLEDTKGVSKLAVKTAEKIKDPLLLTFSEGTLRVLQGMNIEKFTDDEIVGICDETWKRLLPYIKLIFPNEAKS